MVGKLINNKLELFSESLLFPNGECICNPSEDVLKDNGYKTVIRDNEPIIESNQYIEEYYEETIDSIIVHFKLIDIIE